MNLRGPLWTLIVTVAEYERERVFKASRTAAGGRREKKRHTLTFRMRSDLRDAILELAAANHCTPSEQVELYVDRAVFTEAKRIEASLTNSCSKVLRRSISNWERRNYRPVIYFGGLDKLFNRLHILCIDHLISARANTRDQQVNNPDDTEAVEATRLLLNGIVRGLFDYFEDSFGSHVFAELKSSVFLGRSSINSNTNGAFRELEDRYAKAEVEIERLKAEVEVLKARAPRAMPQSSEQVLGHSFSEQEGARPSLYPGSNRELKKQVWRSCRLRRYP